MTDNPVPREQTPDGGTASYRGQNEPISSAVVAAIDIVARHALARAAERAGEEEWSYYGDIGEHDWDRVVRHLDAIAQWPDPDMLERAMALLAERCEG